VEEQAVEEVEEGKEEEHHDAEAEEEEGEHEVDAEALVGLGHLVGQVVHEDLAAVEEGKGYEVEDEEQQVHEDAEVEKEDEREDGGQAFGGDIEVVHGEGDSSAEGVLDVGIDVAQDDERDKGAGGEQKLRGGAGEQVRFSSRRGLRKLRAVMGTGLDQPRMNGGRRMA
jgi:hypothetical protein